MFPYANANLRTYWEDHPTPKFDDETVRWAVEQMTGIASALELIHDFKVIVPLSVPGTDDANVQYFQSGKGGELQNRVSRAANSGMDVMGISNPRMCFGSPKIR